MFRGGFLLPGRLGTDLQPQRDAGVQASGNDFELAIAAAIAVFGIAYPAALATVIGPLVELPVRIERVQVSLYLRRRLWGGNPSPGRPAPWRWAA
jgi:arsenite transporter